MEEHLIKSKRRQSEYGEIFTPFNIVNKMLNQPEIVNKINNLEATFLEPSAGEGAFLVPLLKRRIHRAFELSSNKNQFNENSLIGLSSLYGIELLTDDFETLIKNLIREFQNDYVIGMDKFHSKPSKKVLESSIVIIKANMMNGDTLKYVDKNGNPLILSEWKIISKHKVQRTEYTFEAVVNGEGSIGSQSSYKDEQLDLFALPDDDSEGNESVDYAPCNIINIYKELIK